MQQTVVRLGLTAPCQHLDARQQFGKGKGFDQIVVATGPQALYPVVHFTQGAEDDDRRLMGCAAQGFENRQAVQSRQHAVENDDLILGLQRHEQAVLAVIGLIDAVAVLFQALGDVAGGVGVVFDDEDAHGNYIEVPLKYLIGGCSDSSAILTVFWNK